MPVILILTVLKLNNFEICLKHSRRDLLEIQSARYLVCQKLERPTPDTSIDDSRWSSMARLVDVHRSRIVGCRLDVNERRYDLLAALCFSHLRGDTLSARHDREKPCNSTAVHFISWLEQRSGRSLAAARCTVLPMHVVAYCIVRLSGPAITLKRRRDEAVARLVTNPIFT